MEFEKLIAERYSVRKFKNIPLEKECIDKILKAAHIAPTGCNAQPQRILVIESEEALEKLKGCTKCHFNAPCAFLVCYNRDESWRRPYDGALAAPVDAAIVATHMMLAAHDAGAGSCWVMHFDPAAMRVAFNMPENIIPEALLVMGYPADDSTPAGFHYDSRPMDETVIYDTF